MKRYRFEHDFCGYAVAVCLLALAVLWPFLVRGSGESAHCALWWIGVFYAVVLVPYIVNRFTGWPF